MTFKKPMTNVNVINFVLMFTMVELYSRYDYIMFFNLNKSEYQIVYNSLKSINRILYIYTHFDQLKTPLKGFATPGASRLFPRRGCSTF